MAYKKQTWVDDETVGTADRFNHMEAGIEEAGKTGGVEVGTIVYIEDDAEVPEGYEEVSDDGGIVTVTNSNGKAIKFPDGTMICTKQLNYTGVNINNSFENNFISDNIEFGNFAETFKEIPTKSITYEATAASWLMATNIGNASYCGSGRCTRQSKTENINVRINIIAVGRWK